MSKSFGKKFQTILTQSERRAPKKKWLDEFAFLEIGTLLNSSPKTDLIKMWKSKLSNISFVDGAGNFFITIEQNAIASGSEYKSDITFWNNLRKRYWKEFSELKIFEEGYNKDYIIEERKNIPILQIKQDKNSSIITNYTGKHSEIVGFKIGNPRTLLTIQGAIKFNHRKKSEGGQMIADALKTQTSYPISNILV